MGEADATLPPVRHPLEPLRADEITAAVAAVRASGRITEAALFSTVTLAEPTKESVVAHRPGDRVERRIHLLIVPGPEASVIEAVVTLPGGEVVGWAERDGVRPALLFDDSYRATIALRADPEWQKAMLRRGITDFDKVQIDPWPTGDFGNPLEEGRRIARCLCFYRESPSDNGYARPVEGVLATVDAARGIVLEVHDYGIVPMPEDPGSYLPEDHQPLRTDLKPLEIVQPDGVSFSLDSNLLTWQRWSMRVSMDPLEGLVFHTIGYDDDGIRPVVYRASICEMVVPYGDPGPVHGWKNAFDVGEWGLGRMANSLALGCDCLGAITYLDATFSSEHGHPYVVENAICIHEEDYGILWKHNDMNTGRIEVRRSRRLVVSSISTVGNYEYGFYWYFYLDGTIQLEVKLTGIMSTQAVDPGQVTEYASMVAPGLAAPVHQHLFCARLDLDVDGGPANEVYEISAETLPAGDDNPWGNGFRQQAIRLDTELAARRQADPARGRHWRFVNPEKTNLIGRPVAYKLVPGPTPTLLAQPDSSIGRRAGFARHNLWVTPFAPGERRAAGDYPNQHAGGAGLPDWTAADRSLVGTDIVAWHTFGVTHLPRPEDWPVMPVEYCGFHLMPAGFFDRNPSLDVPPPPGHCD